MVSEGVFFRPATEADIEAERAVFCAAQGDLMERHNFPPPSPPPDAFRLHHRHLLRHDADRCHVAEVDGAVVAFGAAIVRGDVWFLSHLFVHPDVQGRGVGRRVLELCWGRGYRQRMTITDAIQPISNGLYAQHGLIPTTPMLCLEGEPRIHCAGALAAGAVEPAALAMIDRSAYGFSRAVDHELWGLTRRATLWRQHGVPVAYSYVATDGAIGPVAGVDPASAAGALRWELARTAGGAVRVCIPGTAAEMIAVALQAGLRFGSSPPGLLLQTPPASPPRALAVSSYGLY